MGGVKKAIKSATKAISNPVRTLTSAATLGMLDFNGGKLTAGNNANLGMNISTAGMVGVNPDGTIGAGIQPQLAVQGLGEITGANALREQTKLQADAVAQAEENARKERMQQLYQLMNADIAGSIMAGGRLGGGRSRLGMGF